MTQENTQPIIELKHVGIAFEELVVHSDINFSVNQGEAITILGPSGMGKTLILKMIMGLLRPTSGSIYLFGQSIGEMELEDLREIRRGIGMLFQGAALFDSLNVYENIAYSLREFGGKPEQEITNIVAEKLEIVGLPGIELKKPPELSGGQKKRVGLARALASSPNIVLFDEPTTGLDPTAIRMIDELIVRLNQDFGITCISVTHDIESAKRISNRWILINNGVVAADGPVEEVSRDSSYVNDFITGNWKEEMRI